MRIGFAFYSEEPRLEFSLDTFQNPVQILERLDKLTYRGRRERPMTGVALDFLRNKVFTQEKSSCSKQGVEPDSRAHHGRCPAGPCVQAGFSHAQGRGNYCSGHSDGLRENRPGEDGIVSSLEACHLPGITFATLHCGEQD